MGQGEKLPALTGLRFLAAALILAAHSKSDLHIPLPAVSFDHGVSLFFVLSGFILAHVYPRLESWDATKHFLALRVIRIWPAHVVALLLVDIALGTEINERFPANVLMVHGWIPSAPWYFSYNSVSWSISTEFFFYLMFPLLIWNWTRTFWWKWLAALGLLILLCTFARVTSMQVGYSPHNIPTTHGLLCINPIARLLEFVSGMVAYSAFAWLRPYGSAFKERSPKTLAVLATAAEIAVIALVWHFLTSTPGFAILYSQLGPGVWTEWAVYASNFPVFVPLIMILGLGYGWLSRLLSTKLAVLLGEISYSVYLLHQIVFRFYTKHWPQTEPDYSGLAICVGLILILSYMLWKAVELPCRRGVKNPRSDDTTNAGEKERPRPARNRFARSSQEGGFRRHRHPLTFGQYLSYTRSTTTRASS